MSETSTGVEAAPKHLHDRLLRTGATYFVLESSWWGNEKFGTWQERFVGQVEHETEDAILIEDVMTTDGNPVGGGWVPKSKLDRRVDAPEPENHIIFQPDGETRVGKASEADYQLSELDYYQGRYKRYPKVVVDFEFDDEFKENFKRDDDEQWWEDYHATAKFEQDEFVHWWMDADVDLREFARELSDGEYSVAVREDLLE